MATAEAAAAVGWAGADSSAVDWVAVVAGRVVEVVAEGWGMAD